MATSNAQRIGISIILVVMVIGTLGSFFVMILANENQKVDSQQQQEQYAAYQKAIDDYTAKISAQADELSTQYYPIFSQYASLPAPFAIADVPAMKTTDVLVGSGEEVTDQTVFAAYYIGWNPDGKIFDQSINDGKLKAPLAIDGLKDASLITGWKEGMIGMKLGGVRTIEIPSDKAYGEAGQGDDIPPNTPLKFVVMAVPKPDDVPEPDLSAILGAS